MISKQFYQVEIVAKCPVNVLSSPWNTSTSIVSREIQSDLIFLKKKIMILKRCV